MYDVTTYLAITGETLEQIVRLSDNAFIPTDEDNVDYQAFAEWQASRGTP